MSLEHLQISRRGMIGTGLLAGIGAALPGSLLAASSALPLITKAIPSSGEKIPVIGIGTNQFGVETDYDGTRDLLKRMRELGGTVIDTASGYGKGQSEVQIGRALAELNTTNQMFIATKFDAPGIGVPSEAPGAEGSIARSIQRLGKVDLMFILHLDSVESMMPLLLQLKQQGRARYIGITQAGDSSKLPQLAQYLRKYPMDFVQVGYSLGDRAAEHEILPLALERKLAVMAAVPLNGTFGGGNQLLLKQVGDRPLPAWAADFDIASWSQFFLKYVVSHPAITCAIPGSGKLAHLEDNQAAGRGRLPDAVTRRRMEQFWDGKG
jgi:aryl-alcohol dehydrogenase-like predicted oxidoreductase